MSYRHWMHLRPNLPYPDGKCRAKGCTGSWDWACSVACTTTDSARRMVAQTPLECPTRRCITQIAHAIGTRVVPNFGAPVVSEEGIALSAIFSEKM